jgi:hypothetical protein
MAMIRGYPAIPSEGPGLGGSRTVSVRNIHHVRNCNGIGALERIQSSRMHPSAAYLILPMPLRIFPQANGHGGTEVIRGPSAAMTIKLRGLTLCGFGMVTSLAVGSCSAQVCRRAGPAFHLPAAATDSACHRNRAWRWSYIPCLREIVTAGVSYLLPPPQPRL